MDVCLDQQILWNSKIINNSMHLGLTIHYSDLCFLFKARIISQRAHMFAANKDVKSFCSFLIKCLGHDKDTIPHSECTHFLSRYFQSFVSTTNFIFNQISSQSQFVVIICFVVLRNIWHRASALRIYKNMKVEKINTRKTVVHCK